MSDNWYRDKRLGGLWRFATAISILNILGHTWLGFEQAWAHPLVGLAAAYAMELGIETADALLNRRPPRYLGGGLRNFAEFLLSAHITGLAVSMLLYANQRFWVIAFAAAAAIASKAIFRVPVMPAPSAVPVTRHFLNPSNFGIALTLVLFPWVGIAPPYHFTENAGTFFHWALPLLIFASGSLLNTKFTERIPLIAAWMLGFAAQAFLRSAAQGLPIPAAPLPMTGLAFILFSFYMVTDPATTPSISHSRRRGSQPAAQVAFGLSVAAAYCSLMLLHIVFGLFFALVMVTMLRGLWLFALNRVAAPGVEGRFAPVAVLVERRR
jgi:enediyne biosynthesis protein E5